MTHRFFIHNIEGGTLKEFTFSNNTMDIRSQIDAARMVIAEKYHITIEEVEWVDYSYGNSGEIIKI